METAEFLGGKYQKPEQIKPDPVHTFRTKEVSTGRTVFVHRVSTTEAPAEQAGLLRLLLSAVFRSPSARNLILDYGEEQGFWYVITQGEPQCLQLREWLQFEIDHAGGTAGRTQTSGEAPVPPKAQAPAEDPDRTQLATPKVGRLTPEAPPQSASRESGEFTRMFQPAAKPETSPVWNEPAKPAESKKQPGEFTRMFLSKTETAAEESKPAPTPPPPDRFNSPAAKVENPPVEDGPGEFTRFFQGASPAAKNPSEPMPPQDRLTTREVQRPGGVQRAQRPSSPLSQRPSSEPGEFTKMFSRAPESAAPPERRASNLDDMFGRPPAAPSAPPASVSEPGEYTRIFGKGDLGPPAQQPSTVAPQAPASILHDPVAPASPFQPANETTRQVPNPASAAPAPVAQAPSEYTAVMRGLGATGAGAPAGEQAHSAPAGAASGMKLPQAPPIPGMQPPKMPAAPTPHKPAVPGGGMPQMKLPETPKAAAPAPSNKKLIIFFCVLGVLTIVLIVLIALIALKK